MKIEQRLCRDGQVASCGGDLGGISPDVVFLFGSEAAFNNDFHLKQINELYPEALLFGCSTAGEIIGCNIYDETIAVTAVRFEHTKIVTSSIKIADFSESEKAGEFIGQQFDFDGLKHIFILSDGLQVNGSALVKGLTSVLPANVVVTGGLSGDGGRFHETFVMKDGKLESGIISAIGFYGDRIKIGYGSRGGWDPFGPLRMITRSDKNVLFELDGRSALELYKEYLGERAAGLPATGVLFPLRIKGDDNDEFGVVRTMLAVDENNQSLIFAGDVPLGFYARLMKANFDRLVDGAIEAAEISYDAGGQESPDLAILISCVGRKMVLKQRVEEELEGVQGIFGNGTVITGFYSYGEICPFNPGENCELHNQTMTITTLSER
jgi:hypothetical protein